MKQETLFEAIFSKQNNLMIKEESGPFLSCKSLMKYVKDCQSLLIKGAWRSQHPISIILPNGVAFAISFLAVANIGIPAAPLNPNYTENEFEFYLTDSGAKSIIVPKGMPSESPVMRVAQKLKILVWEIFLSHEGKLHFNTCSPIEDIKVFENPKINPHSIALILHTSGTTGRPKGVPLTHTNITRSMLNIRNTFNLTSSDRSFVVMPLFHVHGLIGSFLSALGAGGSVVIASKFSAKQFWKSFDQNECTWYSAVPTIHQILLLGGDDGVRSRTSKLRFIRSCSASLAPAVLKDMEERFGVPVIESYAMTEAAHQMTSNPLFPPSAHKPGSVGFGHGVDVRVVDDEWNDTKIGEVIVKGGNVITGYLNNPQSTLKDFKDGWFRTGDQGYFDKEGYLFLTGRIKELINRGGEKISPLEIDAALLSHPMVAEACSFGMSEKVFGEQIHAVVVLKNNNLKEMINETELKKYCSLKLAKFKIPEKIYISDYLPKTATGKIQRRVVAQHFTQQKAKI